MDLGGCRWTKLDACGSKAGEDQRRVKVEAVASKKVFLFFNPIVPRISSVFNRSIVILDFFLIFPYFYVFVNS